LNPCLVSVIESNLLLGRGAACEPVLKSSVFVRGGTKHKSTTYSRLKDSHSVPALTIILGLAHLDILVLFLLLALHLLGKRRVDSVLVVLLRLDLLLATLGRSGALAGSFLGSGRGSRRRRIVRRDVSMATLEVAHDGLAEVLAVLMVSKGASLQLCRKVEWWRRKRQETNFRDGREEMNKVKYIRDGILGEGIPKRFHGAVNLGPVVAHTLTILGAHDDSDTKIALGVGIPLLLSRRHDDG
jgi:hypothetical protein